MRLSASAAPGRLSGGYHLPESVEALFAQTGEVDAIVSTTGNLHFGPLSTMTDSQFNLGLQDKLLGQIRWRWSASIFCATAGRLPRSAVLSRRNPLLRGQCHDGQRRSGRLCPRRRLRTTARDRINLISPTVLSESLAAYGDFSRASPAFPPPPWRRPIAAALKAFRPAASTRSATSLCRPAGAGAYIRPSLQVH